MSSCTFITCYEGQTQKLFPKHFNTICIRHFLHGTLILQLVCILGSQLIVSCNLYESEFLHARTNVRAQNRTRLKCDTSSVAPDVLPVNPSAWSDEHCSSCCTLSLIRLYLDKLGSKCNQAASFLFVKELALL